MADKKTADRKAPTLEERLNRLCNIRYFTLDSESFRAKDAECGCFVETSYAPDEWEMWLTDDAGSGHRAVCVNAKDECLSFGGPNRQELSAVGKTMEEALAELERRMEILRQNRSFKVLFTWDD